MQRVGDSRRDALRDAQRFDSFLLAIEKARKEIQGEIRQGNADIDAVLTRLLPSFVDAVGGQSGFILRPAVGVEGITEYVEISSIYPVRELSVDNFEPVGSLKKAWRDGTVLVLNPGDDPPIPIPGLEWFEAESAILVRTDLAGKTRLLGVCNKINVQEDPFLASDRKVLESILELIVLGAGMGEQRRQELKSLQKTSGEINLERDLKTLLPLIVKIAKQTFKAEAVCLMLWDTGGQRLVIREGDGLSQDYLDSQYIARQKIDEIRTTLDSAQPLYIQDLRKTPFGSPDLILQEGLYSVLATPLSTSGDLLGLLNIYSKNTLRYFSQDEMELAEIFANQAAIAIRNADLRQRVVEGLLDTSEAVLKTLKEDTLLPMICQKTREIFNADSTALYIKNPEENRFTYRQGCGLSQDFQQDSSIDCAVFEQTHLREPIIIPDPSQDRCSDGTHYRLEQISAILRAPLLDDAGEIQGILEIYHRDPQRSFNPADVKPLEIIVNQASAALRIARLYRSEQQARRYIEHLVDSSLDGIIAANGEGHITLFNKGAQKILGYTQEEVLNGEFQAAQFYALASISAYEIQDMLENDGKIENTEICLRSKNKENIPVLFSATLLSDPQGNEPGSVGFFKDLRPLKNAENELRMMLDTILAVSQAEDQSQGLHAIAEATVRGLDVSFSVFFLLDEANQEMEIAAAIAVHRQISPLKWNPIIGTRIPLAYLPGSWILLNPQSYHIFAMTNPEDQHFLNEVIDFLQISGGLQSLLMIPLGVKGKPRGILAFGEQRKPNPPRGIFLTEKVRLARSVGQSAMILIDRLQAQEAMQKRMRQLEGLREISKMPQVLSSSLKDIMDRMAEVICQITDADTTIIYPILESEEHVIYDVRNIGFSNLRKPHYLFSAKLRFGTEGMAGAVLSRKAQVIVDDIASGYDRDGDISIHLEDNKFLKREEVKAFVGWRLQAGEDVFGALFINFRTPHFFTPDEINTIGIFANQTALTIQQARLHEKGQKNQQTIQFLHDMTKLMGDPRIEINQVWQSLLDGSLAITNARFGRILRWNVETHKYEPEIERLYNGKSAKICRLPYNDSCEFLQARSNERDFLYVADTTRDSRTLQCYKNCRKVHSLLVAPILQLESGDALGVIMLESRERAAFSATDKELLQKNLAPFAAIAIENTRHYRNNWKNALLRQSLLRAGQNITAIGQTGQVLQNIVEQVRVALRCDTVSLHPYYTSRFEFSVQVTSGLMHPDYRSSRIPDTDSVVWKILASGKPYYTADSKNDPWMKTGGFIWREGIASSAGIPLWVGEEEVGVLFVNYRQPHVFQPQEIESINLFANLVASAIQNTRLYEDVLKKSAHRNALNEAGKVITAGLGLSEEDLLDKILEQAVRAVSPTGKQKVMVGTFQLYDERANDLIFKAVYYSPGITGKWTVGSRMELDPVRSPSSRVGICGRTFLTGKPQRVNNVGTDPDYVSLRDEVASELSVPLVLDGKPAGVLNLESDHPFAFDQEDETTLQALAELAAIALKNARQAFELSRNTSLALMGAWGAEVIHDVNREVRAIRWIVYDLMQYTDLPRDIYNQLEQIDRNAENMRVPPLPEGSDLDSKSGKSEIDLIVQMELIKLQKIYPHITFKSKLSCPSSYVAIHPQWLRRLLRHYLINAEKNMPHEKQNPVITVSSILKDEKIEIYIEDNGNGIPPKIEAMIFKSPVPRSGGQGMGLMLAAFLAEIHRGKAWIEWNIPGTGVCFAFSIPIVKTVKEERK